MQEPNENPAEIPTNKIICGNNVDVLATFPDDCIDLTVTSPPYDNLRTYKGFNFDFEGVAQQLYRVTKSGGVVVWVVGDATINGSETGTSFKQALRFMEIGFRLHDTMIWNKGCFSAVGALVCRYAPVFEYMFVLVNDKLGTFNPIKDRKTKHGGKEVYGTVRRADGCTANFSKRVTINDFSQRFNIWDMSPQRQSGNDCHPAPFPEKLAHDHIISWSNEGDIVLDPFSGSGTTAKMAKETNRKFIGIDCSEEYCEIARKRLSYDVDIAAQAEQLTTDEFNDLII